VGSSSRQKALAVGSLSVGSDQEMKRVMWIEDKRDGIVGPARIGWVEVKEKGKKLVYHDQSFRSLNGRGFKSNYYDVDTGREYWITGCRKDGRNALYSTEVEVDEDLGGILDKYSTQAERKSVKRFHVPGKY
jgi:hypothetical protein